MNEGEEEGKEREPKEFCWKGTHGDPTTGMIPPGDPPKSGLGIPVVFSNKKGVPVHYDQPVTDLGKMSKKIHLQFQISPVEISKIRRVSKK